jgi:hypothetical protein
MLQRSRGNVFATRLMFKVFDCMMQGTPMITAKTYAHVLDMQAIEASAVFTKAMG